MSFAHVRSGAAELRQLIRESTGRDLLAAISLEEPVEPEDELHFIKLIAWCYGLLIEAGPAIFRHLQALTRLHNPSAAEEFQNARQSVLNLRTVKFHNLLSESADDERKKRHARIWLLSNGGEPINWTFCCNALSIQVVTAIKIVHSTWIRTIALEEDRDNAVGRMLLAVDNKWPAYIFDEMLERAAHEIGVKGLDIVQFRSNRLNQWQELASYFQTPELAQAGVERAVKAELMTLFGPEKPTS